jgi:acetyl esterase/lipase
MARVDLRLRVWGWLTRRMVSIATMSDADVIALQAKQIPVNPVTNWLFGTVAPEVDVTDRSVPGPAGDLKVRVYRPVPVRFTQYVGMPHGFVNFPGLSRAAHQAMAEVCAEQSAALVPPRASVDEP